MSTLSFIASICGGRGQGCPKIVLALRGSGHALLPDPDQDAFGKADVKAYFHGTTEEKVTRLSDVNVVNVVNIPDTEDP